MNDRIGKCRIIAKLGQGGMANVFLSVVPGHAGVYKLLVVKVLREELAEDADFLAMFLNEARLAARLNHPNVVTTYEIGVDGGQHYLAMDYLDGQPYSAVLRKTRGKIPLDIHLRILADTLAGLDYAHTLADYDGTPLTVVHRDVSPQNVFVGYDGQVKVVDFGIAKAAGAASTTQSGVFKGKLAYVAPEQAAAQPVDARADIFSVGVMLWEAIAGRRLAQGESETTILGRRLAGIEPRIRQVVADVDPELADICDRAMAHHRDHRFPDARSMQDALERVLDRTARRVGRREVGAFVGELFADKRQEIRAVIDEQMKRVLRDTSSALPLPVIGASRSGDPTPTHVEGFARRSSGTLAAANVSQEPPAARAGHGRMVAVALVAVALAAVLGVALVVTFRKPAAVPDAGTQAAAGGRERVALRIEFAPGGATAKLDGVPLASSPFVAQVDRDGSMHRIDVEAPGMAPQTTMVSYDKDVSVSIVLVPEPSSADAAAPAQASAPTAPAAPRGDRPVARPADPKKGGKQPGEIDEADPYRKK